MIAPGGQEWWDRYCAARWPAVTFTVRAADGRVLATVDGAENATRAMNAIDVAECVIRERDGVVIATKYRIKGDHIYSALWCRRHEPVWVSQ